MFLFIFATGFLMLTVGIILKALPKRQRFADIRNVFTMERLVQRGVLASFLGFLSGNVKSRRYTFSQGIISRSETEMSVKALYLLKLLKSIIVKIILFAIAVLLIIAVIIPISRQIKDTGQKTFDVVKNLNSNISTQ
jgi:hypothetical protein